MDVRGWGGSTRPAALDQPAAAKWNYWDAGHIRVPALILRSERDF
jgi:hypothetical protein